ncbi:uncharacterized protein LOC132193112 [Neocloeon triangulifer]|uniref:uncharacterized protein LOC132193112 n=1 Tax=Neocloeon triangulifer TaxID=2078957 RepID=UPI00286FAED0|nr:uncharacterized protein LOC132193112 [Neocloeon triangulifer]
MSADADPELLDLVSKNLEEEGYLYKMRAQLRAKIFQTLENQLNPQKPPARTQLQEFLGTSEGLIVASLVKDFLDFYGLGYADGYFQPVAACGVDFFASPRDDLSKQLGIPEENGKTKQPLLSYLIVKHNSAESKAASNETFVKSNGDLSAKNSPSKCNDSLSSESSPKVPESPIKDVLTVPEAKLVNGNSSENVLSTVKKLEINNDRLSPGLSEIPSMLKPPVSLVASEQLKSLTDTGSLEDSLDHYEEDFQSSATLSPRESRQAAASVSEIEEVISEVVSNSESTVEELTIDATISLSSGFFGDHMQSV